MTDDGIERSAIISPDELYRYRLTRVLAPGPAHRLVFVMLNPSTADATLDDQTIRRCIGYARREGFNTLDVVNLYAYRTKSPDVLRAAHARGVDVLGPDNVAHVDEVLRMGKGIVAWGANAARCPVSPVEVMLRSWRPLWCLGFTAGGHPLHPSRGPNRPLVPWSGLVPAAPDQGSLFGGPLSVGGAPSQFG